MASIFRIGGVVATRNFGPTATLRPSGFLWSSLQCRVLSSSCLNQSSSQQPTQLTPSEDFFVKNQRLNRPVSPHLTIYKFELPALISISHRGTGIFLSLMLSSFSIGMLALPASFPYYFGLLSEAHYGAACVFAVKFLLAYPFTFHAFNGIRHLAWDLGYGFSLRTLYKTGYTVMALSLLSALALASY